MADSNTPPAGSSNNGGNSNNSGTGGNSSKPSVDKQIADIQQQMADNPKPDKDAPADLHREWKTLMNDLSSRAAKLRKQQIANDSKLSDDEKDVLRLYDQGKQIFAIAAEVFRYANQQTVGEVMLIIRKAHANDWDQTEDVNSTKGYTGIGTGAGQTQA